MAKTEQKRKSKNEEDRHLSRELEMSFPASDPPACDATWKRHHWTRSREF
jgi:hypothetical protein